MQAVHTAFEEQDVEQSKAAHESKKHAKHGEKHTKCGEIVYSLVFGGLDGIITSFSVVTAIVGATLMRESLIIIAVANLIGEAIGMALGDFFSSLAENSQIKTMYTQYSKQFDTDPQPMKERLSASLIEKGFSHDQVRSAIDYLSENKKLFVQFVMQEEEGVGEADGFCGPVKDGIAMFFSFISFGLIPIIPYFFSLTNPKEFCGLDVFFWVSIGLTCFSLFLLGIFQKIIVRKAWYTWWQGGLLVLVQGAIAAGISYLVSFLLQLALQLDK
jgi:VIT1/CCC1 family predicted Fe2+/Mn2+ transporter